MCTRLTMFLLFGTDTHECTKPGSFKHKNVLEGSPRPVASEEDVKLAARYIDAHLNSRVHNASAKARMQVNAGQSSTPTVSGQVIPRQRKRSSVANADQSKEWKERDEWTRRRRALFNLAVYRGRYSSADILYLKDLRRRLREIRNIGHTRKRLMLLAIEQVLRHHTAASGVPN